MHDTTDSAFASKRLRLASGQCLATSHDPSSSSPSPLGTKANNDTWATATSNNLKRVMKENHGCAIKQVKFNVSSSDLRYKNLVATVGSNQVCAPRQAHIFTRA
jgi:hypothetical protein